MPVNRLRFPDLDHPDHARKLTSIRCANLALIRTSRPLRYPGGCREMHAQYEFFIPLCPIRQFFVERNLINCQPGQLIPINPGQSHGLRKGHQAASFITVLIERQWMEQLISKVGQPCSSPEFPPGPMELLPEIEQLIGRLESESQMAAPCRDFLLANLTEQLAILLIRHYFTGQRLPELISPQHLRGSQIRFRKVILLMHQQFHQPLCLSQMAELAGMNVYHFIRTFKTDFDISPYRFLTCIRLHYAKQMLRQTDLPVSDISSRCGFKSASRFSAVFQKDTGRTPSRFRRAKPDDVLY